MKVIAQMKNYHILGRKYRKHLILVLLGRMKNYRISRKLIKDIFGGFWLAKIEYLLIISINMFSIET